MNTTPIKSFVADAQLPMLLNRLVLSVLVVCLTFLGMKYYEGHSGQRSTVQTFYAMGTDRDGSFDGSNWHVNLYGADKTDMDELFRRNPLTALTNQAHYEEKVLDKGTDPFLEIYRCNHRDKDEHTVVIRRWCKDLPFDGKALADLIAAQVEDSALLPPPQS